MQPALGSVQFPSLIGLPTLECLLPITVGGDGGPPSDRPRVKNVAGHGRRRRWKKSGRSAELQMFLTEH